ncbi:MAG: hypothetical protein WAR79_11100 [Melioribacteraceae bacterium]
MKLLIKIFFTIFAISFFSCSTTDSVKMEKEKVEEKIITKKINDIVLNIEKTVSWVNLMPGSDSKFHISGKFSIQQNDDYKFEKVELKYVKIYQDEKELYFIQPKIIQTIEKSSKEIIYSTLQGLSVNKDFNKKKNITLELIFNSDGNELKYYIENINVEEVF